MMIYLYIVTGLIAAIGILRWACACNHHWEVLHQKDFHSALEEARKHGWVPDKLGEWEWLKAMARVVIVVASCKLCGAIKTIRETSRP